MVPMRFLTERNIPKRSKYELTYNKLKLQTKTNALIYYFRRCDQLYKKNTISPFDGERNIHEYIVCHCFTSTLNGTASQKITGFWL